MVYFQLSGSISEIFWRLRDLTPHLELSRLGFSMSDFPS